MQFETSAQQIVKGSGSEGVFYINSADTDSIKKFQLGHLYSKDVVYQVSVTQFSWFDPTTIVTLHNPAITIALDPIMNSYRQPGTQSNLSNTPEVQIVPPFIDTRNGGNYYSYLYYESQPKYYNILQNPFQLEVSLYDTDTHTLKNFGNEKYVLQLKVLVENYESEESEEEDL